MRSTTTRRARNKTNSAAHSDNQHAGSWGRYRSVVKARSTEFNLTLDVQTLRQEIQRLETTRSILEQRALATRHSETGSLAKIVREFYDLFGAGYAFQPVLTPELRVVQAHNQVDFVHAVSSGDLRGDSGVRGPQDFIAHIKIHSTCFRLIRMDLEQLEITESGGNVIISSDNHQKFQITQRSLEMMFPHILTNQRLVERLLNAVVETTGRFVFVFNRDNKVAQYFIHTDMMQAFQSIVKDLRDVAALFGQAVIDNTGIVDYAMIRQLQR